MSKLKDRFHCPDCGDVLLSVCPTCSKPESKVYDAAMAEFEAECNGDDAAWDAAHEMLLDTCRRAKEGR